MNLNHLDYRVTFYDVEDGGPEAGMAEWVEAYSCFAGLYEPTQKDVQLGNLGLVKNSVTLNIRNAKPQFVPSSRQVFEIQNGIYQGLFFNVKNVAPAKTSGYVKVVGEEQ